MANEIKILTRVQVSKSGVVHKFEPALLQITQTTSGYEDKIISVGTTEETLSFGDIASPGMVIIRNLDPTNYVEGGYSTGVYGAYLDDTTTGCVPWMFQRDGSVTVYLKANTAACKVQVIIYSV